ncbi:LCP family protein [Arthrobacter sp. KBS0703]|uniref:LCP family protein n=1 Tax=Arthrobacter sp. KBS0703 TaxID=1955698 RepID=UPI00098F73AC|nr:LCP family protein [Arthrobacter sp. KBS0703]
MEPRPDPEKTGGAAPSGGPAKRKRTAFRVLLAALIVIPLVAAGFIFNLARIWNTETATLETESPSATATPTLTPAAKPSPTATPLKPPAAPTLPMNILVLGSDHRRGDPPAANGLPDQRADAMILVHLARDGRHLYGISIMRDTWVPIPGYGEAKINSALTLGGVPLAVKTVESLFGQKIQHVMMMDFEGFRGITEALGGVDVNVKEAFTATFDTHQHFPAGVNRLQGQRALEFVRERHAFADGDFQRIRDQQTFIRATLAKLLSAKTLSNPVTLYKVVSTASRYMQVDKGLNAATLASLAYSLRNVRLQDAVFFNMPTAGFGFSTDGQSIVLPDYGAFSAVGAALGRDNVGAYVAQNRPG